MEVFGTGKHCLLILDRCEVNVLACGVDAVHLNCVQHSHGTAKNGCR